MKTSRRRFGKPPTRYGSGKDVDGRRRERPLLVQPRGADLIVEHVQGVRYCARVHHSQLGIATTAALHDLVTFRMKFP